MKERRNVVIDVMKYIVNLRAKHFQSFLSRNFLKREYFRFSESDVRLHIFKNFPTLYLIRRSDWPEPTFMTSAEETCAFMAGIMFPLWWFECFTRHSYFNDH